LEFEHRIVRKDRRQAEAAVVQLASIVESSSDAIIGTALDGTIVTWNAGAERLLGYTAEEVCGRSVAILAPHYRPDRIEETVQRLRRGESVPPYDTVRLARDGRQVEVSVTLSAIRDGAGQIVGISSISRDIGAQKAIERMKDEFIAIVGHELRTPLTALQGALGLVAHDLTGTLSEQGQQMLDIAVASTDRLGRLIGDILDIARLESGKGAMAMTHCEASHLLTQAADAMRAKAEGAGVTIRVQRSSAPLWADPDRIVQVLTNMISNAIRFSPEGGTVVLGAEREGDHAIVRVTDQGPGLPPDKQEVIFDRFHQVDSSDRRGHAGMGLGLAICRSIVHQHGGRIWVEAVPGRGSTFLFTIPVPKEGPAAPPQHP
jgi:PAS domain S-box-containing protein